MKCKFNLKGLDCANCAREVEEYLNKQSDLDNVQLNFSTLKLTFETNRKGDIKNMFKNWLII